MSTKYPFDNGTNVLIRTVTHYYTGRIIEVTEREIVIEDAAWVANTGRWNQCLTTGHLEEVEPYPDGPVIVSRGAVVDVCKWDFDLPRDTK